MQSLTAFVAAPILITLAILWLLRRSRASYIWQDKATEPPGPTLLPWLGRIHDLPTQCMWLKLKEWADIYGPLYRTQMLGDAFVIITDEKIAEDLLVKRAKNYSDRPAVRSLFDSKSTYGSMEYLPMMGRNQYWARQRRFMHAYLTKASKTHYHGTIDHEVKRLLARLLEDPQDFSFLIEDAASKVVCQLTWNDPDQSEYCRQSAWALLTQLSPAGPITNVVTPLWNLPFSINPWKIAERKRHDEQQRWWMERLKSVRAKLAKNQAGPSFTRMYLEREQETAGGLSGDYEASSALGMMALISIITIAGPLHFFLLAMLYHPTWQAKAQKEIDEVCGSRMPTLSDASRLPILRACIKETMRWRPSIPTGVAHEVEADDVYDGWFIPKGARILALEWAFLRNKKQYPDPEFFRPERWLETGWPTYREPLTEHPTIIGMSSFGWGQRTCIGQRLTCDETLLTCGGLLWAFNLCMKRDLDGQFILPSLDEYKSLLIIKPKDFQMLFEPRDESRRKEIILQWEATNKKDLADRLELDDCTRT